MEDYQKARDLSAKHLKIADHMLTQTYHLVKDPKLLLVVAENLFQSATFAIDAILLWERLYKRIPPYHNSFDNKLEIFKARSDRRYQFSKNYVPMIKNLRAVLKEHIDSPVEFTRKEKFVICSDEYQIKALSHEKLKDTLGEVQSFVQEMEGMVKKHERIV